jgi:hypothetical protein
MNRTALLAGIGAGLLLAAGTANAGVCSGEIMALQKQLADTPAVANNAAPNPDPGAAPLPAAGPEPLPSPGATLGAAPSAAAPSADSSSTAPSGSGEAAGSAGATGQPIAGGGTPVQNGAGADAPDETAPMDSEAAEAGALSTAAGADPDAAAQSLARAQVLDQAGDEAGCMKEVDQAKGQLGQR